MTSPTPDTTPSGRLRQMRRPRFWYLVAIGLAVLPMLVAELVIERLRTSEMEGLVRQAEVGASVAHQVVLRRLEAAQLMHDLAQSAATLASVDNVAGRDTMLAALANSTNARQFGFVQAAMIGRDGWMQWSSISGFSAPVFLGDREHFRVHAQGLRETFISEPVLGRVSNRWTVQVTRPLLGEGGAFAGVVVLSLDLLDVSAALREIDLRTGDRASVLREGVVAANTARPEEVIGRRIAAGDMLRNLPPDREAGHFRRQNADGHPVLSGWRRVKGTPLVVVYSADIEAAMAGFGSTAALSRAAGIAGAAVVLLAMGLFVSQSDRRMARAAASHADAERSLAEEARATYRRRISGLPAVVYGGLLDPEGAFEIQHVSENITPIAGWSAEELMYAESWRGLFDPAEAAYRLDFKRQVLAQGTARAEFRLRRKDGGWVSVRDSARIVERRPDGLCEIVGYIADITEEREIAMKAQASAKLATLGEMATGLAHELNQPLAVMSLAADNATRTLDRRGAEGIPDVLTRLGRIAQQATRAREIVDHLRVFGRPDEGALEALSLAKAVHGAVLLTNGALRDAGVEVTVSLAEQLPQVKARLVPLEQALVNLLLNARDAIRDHRPAGDQPAWIRIGARLDADRVVLTVGDNGGGIPQEAIDRLFEPFFTTKAPGKGTGLGLSICHATMRGFGGGISVSNGPDGAVFELSFVLADQTVPDVQAA
jgi:PAS domain S-box-containing protein